MTSRQRRRDDLEITWRELAWMFLPAIAVVAGVWMALVYVLTTGEPPR